MEVTRLHRAPDNATYGGPLLTKLRQLPPSVPNVVLMAIEGGSVEAIDVAGAARALRARADSRDDAFFGRRGFESARAFYQRYLRLGAVLVFGERTIGDARAAVWTNRSARIAVPERALRACLTCLRAG